MTDMSKTDNRPRRVLVTGASKGIGKAIAERLGADGFDICVHYGHDAAGAEETLKNIEAAGGRGSLISFDVADEKECREALTAETGARGAFYGVVLNAGITRDTAFPAMESKDWHDVIDVNLNAFYHVLNPLVMPMLGLREGGRIVVMSSVTGVIGNRGQVNYAASKAGLIAAAKSLAIELGKRRVTVNAIAPGLIETAMTELDPEFLKEALKLIPLRRMGKPEEVAALTAFLMSDAAAYITRQVIGINGGLA